MVIILSITIFSLSSCVEMERPAWSQFAEINSDGWDPVDILIFEPEPYDTLVPPGCRYDFDVVIRSSARSDIQKLPVAVCVEDEDHVIRTDTLVLFDPTGPAISSRRNYGVRESSFRLISGQRLSDGFSITLSPLLDASASRGLLNIGIVMQSSD